MILVTAPGAIRSLAGLNVIAATKEAGIDATIEAIAAMMDCAEFRDRESPLHGSACSAVESKARRSHLKKRQHPLQ
jgi:hypothetical protein